MLVYKATKMIEKNDTNEGECVIMNIVFDSRMSEVW